MSDRDLRALERAARTDPSAEAALVRARLRTSARDPRQDPEPGDVVDARGPGQRVHAYPGDRSGWGSSRRKTGSGPVCRLKGRKVVALWPQVTVAELEARPNPTYCDSRSAEERLVIPAGTKVQRGIFYSATADETSMPVTLPSPTGGRPETVEVLVRGRVETRVPRDRRDDCLVEWVQVLYPEVTDEADVQAALRALASRLSPADLEALRAKVEPRTADTAVRYGSSHTESVHAWRRWAKGGIVRRVGP